MASVGSEALVGSPIVQSGSFDLNVRCDRAADWRLSSGSAQFTVEYKCIPSFCGSVRNPQTSGSIAATNMQGGRVRDVVDNPRSQNVPKTKAGARNQLKSLKIERSM